MKTLLAWLLSAVSVLLASCASQDVLTSAQVAGNLAVAKAQYQDARGVLSRRIALLDDAEKATAWQALLDDSDALKASLEAVWDAKLTPTAADLSTLYAAGATLYATGIKLISPELARLPIEDQIRLRRFDATLRALASLYQEWLESPSNETANKMLSNGLEMMRLALQLGIAVL